MPASLDRLQFAPPAPPGMLRALGLALIVHMLLMLALGWGVSWKRDPVRLSAEAELWSSLPQEAAPRLVEPLPVSAPPLPAPPPVVNVEPPRPDPAPREAEIAVEREKQKQAEARRKQLALEQQKREAEKKKQLEAKRESEERRKQELAKARAAEDKQKLEAARTLRTAQEAKRIEAQRQANLERMKGLAGATGAPTATGTAVRSSGPSSSYGGRIAARLKPLINHSREVPGNAPVEVEVRVAPEGTITSQRVVKSSGDRAWDEAVIKAVIAMGSVPRDTDGRIYTPINITVRQFD